MMRPNPENRPTVNEILEKHLLSDLELELKWVKKNISFLEQRIVKYESMLKIKRKLSY